MSLSSLPQTDEKARKIPERRQTAPIELNSEMKPRVKEYFKSVLDSQVKSINYEISESPD